MRSNQYYYKAFGLHIESEMDFPQLYAAEPNDAIDIAIVFGKIDAPNPENWIERVAENKVLINIPGVVRCAVENGHSISFEPAENVPLQNVRVYLQAIVMVVLLYQKAITPFHACGIVHDNKAYIFAGDSGIGKSTLAGAFFKRGFRIICDDLCIVRKNAENICCVYPGYPFIKLWQESLTKLAIPFDNLDRVYSTDEKYYVPLGKAWSSEPVPLGSINFLTTHEKNEISIQPLKTLDKLVALRKNLFRPYLVNMLGLNNPIFDISTNIIQQVPLHLIERPQNGFMLDELVEMIINKILK